MSTDKYIINSNRNEGEHGDSELNETVYKGGKMKKYMSIIVFVTFALVGASNAFSGQNDTFIKMDNNTFLTLQNESDLGERIRLYKIEGNKIVLKDSIKVSANISNVEYKHVKIKRNK